MKGPSICIPGIASLISGEVFIALEIISKFFNILSWGEETMVGICWVVPEAARLAVIFLRCSSEKSSKL